MRCHLTSVSVRWQLSFSWSSSHFFQTLWLHSIFSSWIQTMKSRTTQVSHQLVDQGLTIGIVQWGSEISKSRIRVKGKKKVFHVQRESQNHWNLSLMLSRNEETHNHEKTRKSGSLLVEKFGSKISWPPTDSWAHQIEPTRTFKRNGKTSNVLKM